MSVVSRAILATRKAALWLWNSPTFTTWGNYGIQSLRLLLVTPLILTRFDETEIAAWYLFASLNFFGTIIGQRLGLTFSRMFAFAMGGASNLAPIKGARKQENEGQPNWKAFERAYGTVGSLNFGIAWLNVLIALGMGWFGLNNLLDGYEAKATIWLSFAVMQATALIGFIYQRYSIALVGMNYVALSNRWDIIFSLLSVIAGSLTLYLSDNLLVLVGVMQSLSLLGLVRAWLLLRFVEEGRVARMKSYTFDREVFGWAWEPTWKGFVGQFGQMGSLQLTAIIYTAYGTKGEVASYLFALRMMQTISQIAQAPFSAVQPQMSRLRSLGQTGELRSLILERASFTLGLTLLGILTGGLLFPFAMDFIESSISFVSTSAWFLLGALTLLMRFNVLCCAVSAIGNEMIYFWEMTAAAVISAGALLMLSNSWGVFTPILTSTIPLILILNFRPVFKARSILSV